MHIGPGQRKKHLAGYDRTAIGVDADNVWQSGWNSRLGALKQVGQRKWQSRDPLAPYPTDLSEWGSG
jgi:hypothetical protein